MGRPNNEEEGMGRGVALGLGLEEGGKQQGEVNRDEIAKAKHKQPRHRPAK